MLGHRVKILAQGSQGVRGLSQLFVDLQEPQHVPQHRHTSVITSRLAPLLHGQAVHQNGLCELSLSLLCTDRLELVA